MRNIHRFYGGDKLLVLITYDVSTINSEGKTRLRKVAKECVNYGQRVQNSVFECILDSSQLLALKDKLTQIINKEEDSLRFYNLGNSFDRKIECIGLNRAYEADGFLCI